MNEMEEWWTERAMRRRERQEHFWACLLLATVAVFLAGVILANAVLPA